MNSTEPTPTHTVCVQSGVDGKYLIYNPGLHLLYVLTGGIGVDLKDPSSAPGAQVIVDVHVGSHVPRLSLSCTSLAPGAGRERGSEGAGGERERGLFSYILPKVPT